uniref:Uncharacterized protein LOC104265675 n=1 Tax=Phallusia mammillata TaxID=59560 RepID=A0A6F9DJI6_9ASCI|nr:uncharacterized protein LOC104265675 [Phallusia mammillata]
MGRPRVVKKFSKTVDVNQGKLGGNKTDYRSTFVEHRDFSPPKNLKPPPTPPRPRFPAMQSETTTKHSYVQQDVTSKRDMIIPRPKTDADFQSSQVKFDDRTTNKQSFQDWKPELRKRYGEFPTYTAPLLYPDKRAMMEDPDVFKSRSQIDFPYKTIPKPEMVKAMEPNIKVGEGERNLQTTHRSAFQFSPKDATRTLSMRPGRNTKSLAQRQMELTTKYQADFPHRKKYPLPPKPTTPAPDTLEIKMNDKYVLKQSL